MLYCSRFCWLQNWPSLRSGGQKSLGPLEETSKSPINVLCPHKKITSRTMIISGALIVKMCLVSGSKYKHVLCTYYLIMTKNRKCTIYRYLHTIFRTLPGMWCVRDFHMKRGKMLQHFKFCGHAFQWGTHVFLQIWYLLLKVTLNVSAVPGCLLVTCLKTGSSYLTACLGWTGWDSLDNFPLDRHNSEQDLVRKAR